jgi:CRP-like cAMP-binding protein
MNEKIFGKGEIIFSEGDQGNSFFQIVEGTVGVYVNYGKVDQRKLTDLTAGQYFGEMAVIETWPRSTTVVAEDNVHVVEIPEEKLNDYFEENPDKILALMKHLGNRIRSLTDEYAEVNAFLAELRDFKGDKQSESFLTKIKKYIGIYSAAKKNLSQPSVEALREMSGLKSDASLPVESYKKGTIIFKKGEVGKCMYAVHGGNVGIYSDYGTDDEKKLTELLPGSFFGEMGMIDEEQRSATAVADADETYVEIIRPDDLEILFKVNPGEVDLILRHLSHRLRKLTDDYMDVCKEVCETWNA